MVNNEAKRKLIEMAKKGEPRPRQSLGRALKEATTRSSYDPKLDKVLRALRPDWFE